MADPARGGSGLDWRLATGGDSTEAMSHPASRQAAPMKLTAREDMLAILS
jgi:hypothetical protein